MAAKKAAKEKRISLTISGTRLSTAHWLRERAAEADLPFSKYVSLWLDAIKDAGEEAERQGGGGNRTRQLLATWFSGAARRGIAQRKAA